ncbi:MAG: NAD(P)-dependent glycerol-3-phosphate dehydrogenase [Myxococcales bacterium]|nr:NAD(P)-dependent glycerol-3-phosphate dehydrogenase [Myxococcales bacterium]
MKEQPITPPLPEDISVVGGGTMGTALAHLLAGKGIRVRLWVYEPELVDAINAQRENTLFLPGLPLHPGIVATSDLGTTIRGAPYVLSVTPAQHLRRIWTEARSHLADDAAVICASKGIEVKTGMLMSQVFDAVLGPSASQRLAFLSGPSFAREILDGMPTAVVVASENLALAEAVQRIVSTATFRAYTTDDVIGVELGGALKNVIAIAVGAAEGLGLGINSRAALITRGLAEITRLSIACGGTPLTQSGLSGMGDLVLTCTGHLSRNLQVGIRLGRGEILSDILSGTRMVAEGVATAGPALELARSVGIEMPITETVVHLLDGSLSPEDAVTRLMGRRLRSEKED